MTFSIFLDIYYKTTISWEERQNHKKKRKVK